MNDPILDEIHAVRRQHWLEAGGTWEGLCACYDRLSAEMDEKGPEMVFRELLAVRKRARMASEGAGCVREERGVYGAGTAHAKSAKSAKGEGTGEMARTEARRHGGGEGVAGERFSEDSLKRTRLTNEVTL